MTPPKPNSKKKLFVYPPPSVSAEPRSAVGRGGGLHFADVYFRKAKQSLRIASGYFYLSGYNATREFIDSTINIEFLAGKEGQPEKALAGRDRVFDTVSKEISDAIKEIYKELGRTPVELYEAVRDLMQRIVDEKFILKEARQVTYSHIFHCKFYISDSSYMWSGSANFTGPGLKDNAEQVSATCDTEEIAMFTGFYDEEMVAARDLLAEVRECLQGWLDMLSPFDAYLKILHDLFSEPDLKLGEGGHYPTYYQEGIILNAIEQLEANNGCLLLIATGLGKTVVGAEIARRVTAEHFIKNVLVLAPRIVQKNWTKQLDEARQIKTSFFDIGMLFKGESPNRTHTISRLLGRLAELDKHSIILIDEAHYYRKTLHKDWTLKKKNARNSNSPAEINRVKDRLLELAGRDVKMVLLTATPYGTDRENVNSLLSLLPSKNAPRSGLLQDSASWQVNDLREVVNLPVVTAFGLFHLLRMARDRGDVEDNGRIYVDIGSGRHEYLPQSIVIDPVFYKPFLEEAIGKAFEESIFTSARISVTAFSEDKGKFISPAADIGSNLAMRAWLGSPDEMKWCTEASCEAPDKVKDPRADAESQTTLNLVVPDAKAEFGKEEDTADEWKIDHFYKLSFTKTKRERQKTLRPVIDQLGAMPVSDDDKVIKLRELLLRECKNGNKVIVFVEYHATAIYVFNALLSDSQAQTDLRVECMVQQSHSDNAIKSKRHTLKAPGVREDLLLRFAPNANNAKNIPPEEMLDVLICTDADGIGVNMQDACVVVNYDLPSGADELFQRAGRVLRTTSDPERSIYLYNFFADFKNKHSVAARLARDVQDTLMGRHDNSSVLLGNKILSRKHQEVSLQTSADVDKFAAVVHSTVEDVKAKPDAFMTHNSPF